MLRVLIKRRKIIFIIGILTMGLISGGTVIFITTSDSNSSEQRDGLATKDGRRVNRLINEKSPYLLQHAYNPVDWYPWGDEAFEKARKENKLIFLSVGYSTCFWCHQMERQVFENDEIAALMNKDFISIKVDREERPDVDRVYMAALQAMTRGGGWPMSMFLTPDLKPFYGATFIPPEAFKDLLGKIQEIWGNDPGKINQSGERLTEFLKQKVLAEATNVTLDRAILTKGFEQFRASYDKEYAGFGGGPKFPRPATFNFLLRYYSRSGDAEALQMTLTTLHKMAEGGMYDHLGGGFHRYSVDGQWRVPHFEKMLYDQAQLVSVYLDAYQITKDEYYASVARDTLRYVLGKMTDREGGFYSAEDAESAIDPRKPKEKQEGAFYLWTRAEIERILGNPRADIYSYAYGVESSGNALEDPHKVFVGKNILYTAHHLAETAKQFKKSPDEIRKLLAESRAKLFIEREKRPRPHLDDKVLVSWNGLMISALARAYQVLGDRAYLAVAEKSADFILTKLYDPKAKRLLRRYRAGEARYDANLEDYAFFTMALLDLYEAAFDIRWLKQAGELAQRQNALFSDEKNGGFFDTSGSDSTLLFRSKDDYDAAEPAGNSIALMNLLRLSQMLNNQQFRAIAERTFTLFSGRLKEVPQALPQMLAAADFHLDKPKQIIIAGQRWKEDTERMLRELHNRYIPNKIILLADHEAGQEFLSQHLSFIESVKMLNEKATAYICENYACKLPTSDIGVMAKLLDNKKE